MMGLPEMDPALLMQRLGPVGIPLALCSVAATSIVLEKTVRAIFAKRIDVQGLRALAEAARRDGPSVLTAGIGRMPEPLRSGAAVLMDPLHDGKTEREDAATQWLDHQRAVINRGVGLLQLIAGLAPMLGLLGTVIGMTVAFRDIAGHDGPVHPALLADGLWQALLTTIVGMAIALPATVAAWIFQALTERRIARLASALTVLSLSLDQTPAHRTQFSPPRMAEAAE